MFSTAVSPPMSAPVLDKEIADKFRAVTVTNYKDQAIFYLNAFWTEGADAEAESVWQAAHGFAEVDHAKGKNGNELNEVAAHHYLQSIGRTLTAIELRKELRKIDIDANGEMALCEYLLFLNNRDVIKCVTNPQGGEANPQELKDAQARLDALTAAFDQLQVQLDQQKQLEAASKKASAEAVKGEAEAVRVEGEAVAAENDAKDAEAKVRAAEAEVRAAEAEAVAIDEKLKAEQDAHNNELARLEALSQDQSVGVVRRNTAVQQLASLKEADPLPLQRAKMSQEAQVRKVQKVRVAAEEQTAIAAGKTAVAVEQRQAAEAARAAAEAARAAAEAAAAAAEEQTKAVEAQLEDVKKQTAEAEEKLTELKSRSGVPHGAIWWMEREIIEKKKSLPQRFQ